MWGALAVLVALGLGWVFGSGAGRKQMREEQAEGMHFAADCAELRGEVETARALREWAHGMTWDGVDLPAEHPQQARLPAASMPWRGEC